MKPTHKELELYSKKFSKELTNILSWWKDHAVEKKGEGFHGAADLEGRPILEANKSCVLNTRILWTFSAAAKFQGHTGYMDLADRAFQVVTEQFTDHKFGGFYMELTPDNLVSSDIKHTYAQAFALYSLCKYHELKPSPELMKSIQNTFLLFLYKI